MVKDTRSRVARIAVGLMLVPLSAFADGIVVEALVEQHLTPAIDRTGGQTLTAG